MKPTVKYIPIKPDQRRSIRRLSDISGYNRYISLNRILLIALRHHLWTMIKSEEIELFGTNNKCNVYNRLSNVTAKLIAMFAEIHGMSEKDVIDGMFETWKVVSGEYQCDYGTEREF